jgi:hypothetical protein
MNFNYEFNDIRNKINFLSLSLDNINNSIKINYTLMNNLMTNQIKILNEQKNIINSINVDKNNLKKKNLNSFENRFNYDINIKDFIFEGSDNTRLKKKYKNSSTSTNNFNNKDNDINYFNNQTLNNNKNINVINKSFLVQKSFETLKDLLKNKKKEVIVENDNILFEKIDIKVNNIKDLLDLCYYAKNKLDQHTKIQKKSNFKITKKIIEGSCNLNNYNIKNLEVINISKNNYNYYKLDNKTYPINLDLLINIINPLKKLKRMIGMDNIKKNIIDQILYYIQDFDIENNGLLHTVIKGPPGVGKTEIGKIIASILSSLNVISSDKVIFAKRSDLIGEYLGQTAIKTQRVIDKACGGVLFIDEAYSLGNKDNNDSYSKECIDILNQNLTENKKKFICIIAGYSDELENCFFSINPGLKRRFPFVYKINSYNSTELKEIFKKCVNDDKWKLKIKDSKLENFFKENKNSFKNYGGDMEVLFLNCKYTHSKRVFLKNPNIKKKIILDDLQKAFIKFKDNSDKDEDHFFINSLYV